MNLQQRINGLIHDSILTEVNEIFSCGCGSQLKRNSIRSHLKSKKHTLFYTNISYEIVAEIIEIDDVIIDIQSPRAEKIEEITMPHIIGMECGICCEKKIKFIYCNNQCANPTCTDCFCKLREDVVKQCPFCRAEFPNQFSSRFRYYRQIQRNMYQLQQESAELFNEQFYRAFLLMRNDVSETILEQINEIFN